MNQISVLLFLSIAVIARLNLAQAQVKTYRVGVLSTAISADDESALTGLREGLREFGYAEGKNLILEIPYGKTHDELRPIAKAYAEKPMDIIVAIGGTTGIVQDATRQLPIVFVAAGDPTQRGFAKASSRSGTNITGVTNEPDIQFTVKRLEIFKEALPILRRVIVLYNARDDNPTHRRRFVLLEKAAPSLKLSVFGKPVKSDNQGRQEIAAVSRDSADGVFLICSSLFQTDKIAAAAAERKLPFMGCSATQAEREGSLLIYSTSRHGLGRRAAWYVDQILKGAKPQDLPIEAPTRFELIINLRIAKAIGLTIVPDILARADKVIR